ncbi:hypothetical protein, partial [Azospirillum sp. B4]|uniref:hypothetical protein n=1 Tax=Azospirillum sp. B4 TaxID=95605 RepID=UPI001901C8FD
MTDRILTADIKAALRARYPAAEYALVFEVAEAVGMGAHRRADALVMSLWPSRGLTLQGYEI